MEISSLYTNESGVSVAWYTLHGLNAQGAEDDEYGEEDHHRPHDQQQQGGGGRRRLLHFCCSVLTVSVLLFLNSTGL
jgi:hypothetical protein